MRAAPGRWPVPQAPWPGNAPTSLAQDAQLISGPCKITCSLTLDFATFACTRHQPAARVRASINGYFPRLSLLKLARDVLESPIVPRAERDRVGHVPVVREVQSGQMIIVPHDCQVPQPGGKDRVLCRHRLRVGHHRLLLRSHPLYLEDARA